jgi:hypothetical protein
MPPFIRVVYPRFHQYTGHITIGAPPQLLKLVMLVMLMCCCCFMMLMMFR